GSVSVAVAAPLALPSWRGRGLPGPRRLLPWRGGSPGDTFLALRLCAPPGGLPSLWPAVLAAPVFAPPVPRASAPASRAAFAAPLAPPAGALAAVVVAPVVPGAGGLRFPAPRSLPALRALCR
ncbi:adenosylmethionine--8-amino-7-oxononanoate aminotransferase BioA, partial [Mycobacterium tuberculosis]